MKTVAVIGHRPNQLFGYSTTSGKQYQSLTTKIFQTLIDIMQTSPDEQFRIITGGSQGAEQCAFWAANALKQNGYNIINEIFAPFPGQDYPWATTALFNQHDYQLILQTADAVRYASQTIPKTKDSAKQILHDRNNAMVAESDYVIAIWKYGDPKNAKTIEGGTAQSIRTCLALNIPLTAIPV